MPSNADVVRDIQIAFNARAWDKLVERVADDCVVVDGQGQVLRGKDGVLAYAQGWVTAFSNGAITDERIYDAGDTVVTEFVGRGTHDGPLGPMPATGRSVALPYAEIWHFDSEGMVTSLRAYVDMLGLMTQLGAAPAIPAQADARTESATPTG